MSSNMRKEDVRSKNTETVLCNAILTLLTRMSFKKITVRNLCEEAQISRATFYTHFIDKYDLLKFFLTTVRENIIKDVYKYEELERDVNLFISLNKKMITNVLKDIDGETMIIVRGFMESIIILTLKRNILNETSPNYVILINFFVGGLINLLSWLVENNFPPEINMINSYLYKMFEAVTIWDAEQEQDITIV